MHNRRAKGAPRRSGAGHGAPASDGDRGSGGQRPPDKLEEIKRIYYKTTAATVQRDFARAIDLLKSMPSEAKRERATVYMEGLAEMRKEWMRKRR